MFVGSKVWIFSAMTPKIPRSVITRQTQLKPLETYVFQKAQSCIRIMQPMMTVVEDTTKSGHDTIAGCCSAWSNEMLYGVSNVPGCRENFLSALARHDLGWQDIVPNINFFCSVPVYEDGHTEDSVFVNGRSVAGDYVELRAETDVLAVISNCPQVNNPCNSGNPTEIRVQVYER